MAVSKAPWLPLLGVMLCTLAVAKQLSLVLEHSTDGSNFMSAGQITGEVNMGDTKRGSTLTFQRDLLDTDTRAQLDALVQSNGLYKLRVSSDKVGTSALTSIPARCLVSSNCTERLHLHLTSVGEVTAINFALLQCPCHAGISAPHSLPQSWAFADESAVLVWLPERAPALHLPPKPPQDKDKTPSQQAKGRTPASDLTGARTPLAEGEAADGEGEGVEPPKDERSWLQKNWLILLPLGFVLVNVLGQLDPGAAGGRAPAAGGRGGAAAPARRR